MKGRGTECEGTGGGFWSLGKRGCAAAVVSSPRPIGEDAWDPARGKTPTRMKTIRPLPLSDRGIVLVGTVVR